HRAAVLTLLRPAEVTGAFMRVLEAVRTAPDPAPVDPAYVTWLGEGDESYPVIADIETWCARAAAEHKLFSELGAPWAGPRGGAAPSVSDPRRRWRSRTTAWSRRRPWTRRVPGRRATAAPARGWTARGRRRRPEPAT